jgi:putative Mg2+ transporter-C (MgtC) family protein
LNDQLMMILRIALALLLGAVIGWERERDGKEAGLRTHMLICAGASLFTLVSLYGFSNALIAAGVVSGIGFLGAGAIIKSETGMIKGLTTAASIWVSAAIGLACGVGLYIVAAAATIIAVFILILHPHIAPHIVHYVDSEKSKK